MYHKTMMVVLTTTSKEANPQRTDNTDTHPPRNQNVKTGKKPICKYYKTKSCKHGAKGTGCAFSHPPKCLKFLKYGDISPRGCKKGSKCDRYHPKLCYNAINKGWCDKENCQFHHILGTKNSAPLVQQNQPERNTSYSSAVGRPQAGRGRLASTQT